MTIIWEDEHYIYEETSINYDDWTITIKRTEKPPKQRYIRQLKYEDYIILILSESKEESWIIEIQIRDKHWHRNYDYKKKEFDEELFNFVEYYTSDCDDEKLKEEFKQNYVWLMNNLVRRAIIRFNPKKYIDEIRENIKWKQKIISVLKKNWCDVEDLEREVEEDFDTITELSKYLCE